MMNTRFSGREFWELVEAMEKDCLYKKWLTLNSKWYRMLMDINGVDVGYTQAMLVTYIKNNGSRMGVQMQNNLYALQGSSNSFYRNVKKPNEMNGVSDSTNEEMIKKGFTEAEYLKCIKIFSEFITFAYPNECPIIPDTIVEMYSNIQLDEPDWTELSLKDLADNPKDRVPVIFIIDNALYMEGSGDDCLTELKDSFGMLINNIDEMPPLAEAVELSVATCGGGFRPIVDFAAIEHQRAELLTMTTTLKARGRCLMGEAIDGVLNSLERRIEQYRDESIRYYCPWLIILSNGSFVDLERNAEAYERLQRLKERGEIRVYPIGVTADANMENLERLDSNEAGILKSYEDFFKNVFVSLKGSQHSQPADNAVVLKHYDGWAK